MRYSQQRLLFKRMIQRKECKRTRNSTETYHLIILLSPYLSETQCLYNVEVAIYKANGYKVINHKIIHELSK